MLIKAVDLSSGIEIVGNVNILKKSINILEEFEDKEISKVYISFPAERSILRFYKFPKLNDESLKKAINLQLSTDLPVPMEDVDYRYVKKEIGREIFVFCVVVLKDEIENLKKEKTVLDSEIFSLVRLFLYNGKKDGKILYFSRDCILYIQVKNEFPEVVRILNDEEALKLAKNDDVYLSGFIPENIKPKNILKNPYSDTSYNVCYGLLLRNFYDIGVDFNTSDTAQNLKLHIKTIFLLFLSILIFNAGLYGYSVFQEKIVNKIKNAQKEVFMKYVSSSEVIIDPLMQVKGKLSLLKSSSKTKIDAFVILAEIGKAKKFSKLKKIKRININKDYLKIEGVANSISEIERFKNMLQGMFDLKISQTSKTLSGSIRFEMEGSLK